MKPHPRIVSDIVIARDAKPSPVIASEAKQSLTTASAAKQPLATVSEAKHSPVIASAAKQSISPRRCAPRDHGRMKLMARPAGLRPSQAGFSLLEISLALALAAMVSIGYLYNQSRDTEFNNAKAQAGYFLTVNDAVGKYMLTFYEDLKHKDIGADCSTVRLTAGDTPAPTTDTCTFKSGSATGTLGPANVMQPTVAELQKLGMLDKSFQDSFLWSTLTTVNRPYASTCDPTKSPCTTTPNATPAVYATRIQKWCDGVLVTPANKLSCASPQFKSLTFNAQPFADADIGSFLKMARFEKLNTAISSMGGDGFMSLEPSVDTEGQGKLYGVGKKTSLDNPILFMDAKNASGSSRGVAGIMAIQNAAELRCKAN